MSVRNTVSLVFLLLGIVNASVVFGQDDEVFADSTSFADFLMNQGEVPGLQFQLIDTEAISYDSSTSIIGSYVDFAKANSVKDSLSSAGISFPSMRFLIFSEANTFQAVQEYVSILLLNGEIEPKTAESSTDLDLITLASRERYSPLFTAKYFSYSGDFKIFIVILTISIFFIFAFFMILFMLIFKAKRNRNEKLKAIYDEQIVGPLSEILFEKSLEELESLSNEELYLNFPEKQLKKAIYVEVLVDRIIALNKKMKGDFKLKLKALYKRLELDKVSIKKLKSSKWDRVVSGLVEVNEMDLTEAVGEVNKHINSSNFHVRSQAVATILNLSESVDLSFLRDQTFPLSRWQQM
ncbi:hypothetical protein, partial [Algoriphagus sp.]